MRALWRDPILVATAVCIAALALLSFALPVPASLVVSVGWWADFVLLAL